MSVTFNVVKTRDCQFFFHRCAPRPLLPVLSIIDVEPPFCPSDPIRIGWQLIFPLFRRAILLMVPQSPILYLVASGPRLPARRILDTNPLSLLLKTWDPSINRSPSFGQLD